MINFLTIYLHVWLLSSPQQAVVRGLRGRGKQGLPLCSMRAHMCRTVSCLNLWAKTWWTGSSCLQTAELLSEKWVPWSQLANRMWTESTGFWASLFGDDERGSENKPEIFFCKMTFPLIAPSIYPSKSMYMSTKAGVQPTTSYGAAAEKKIVGQLHHLPLYFNAENNMHSSWVC